MNNTSGGARTKYGQDKKEGILLVIHATVLPENGHNEY